MTNDLDTRARAGARALQDAVRGVPVTTGPRTTAPRGGRILLVAAVAILVVAVAASIGDDGARDAGLSTDATGAAPRLVIDPAPAGMAVSGAADLPLDGETTAQGTYWVYGDAGADDLFAAGDLALVQVASDTELPTPRTEVDGHAAWVSPPADDPAEFGGLWVYVELDGSTLGLGSRTLSDTELLALAGDLDLDAVPFNPPDTLAELDQVGTARGALSPDTMLPFPVGVGHLAGYSDDAGDGARSIVVASVEGGDGALAVARWALGDRARPVEVRGQSGWVGAPYGDGSWMVVWQESPTVLVTVTGSDVDEDAVLAAAESVRTATDAEWAELITASGTVSVPRDAQVGVSNGDVDGSGYAAYVDAQGALCVDVATTDGRSGACGGSAEDQELAVGTERLASGDLVVYGYTTLGTDGELRIEREDGSLTDLSEAFGEDGTVFAGLFTDETLPTEIVVWGADGSELARTPVVNPGTGGGGSFSGQGTEITTPSG